MKGLERAVEWLRPLVDAKKAWDYCVVWKLGDDPSRFIEWVGCCCSGAGENYGDAKVKEESGEEQQLPALCRDSHFKHAIWTKACEALQHFPFSMALYSGIHGEVVITNQPRWLIHANPLDSNYPHESNGTRVLIPVFGGLIELFASKHKPKDQKIIDFVVAQCNASTDQVTTARSYANMSLNERRCLDPCIEDNLRNYPSSFQLLTLIPSIQNLHPATPFNTHPSYEGSSIASNPSTEHPSFDSNYSYATQNEPLKQSIIESSGCDKPKYDDKNMLREQTELVLGCNNKVVTRNKKAIQRPGRENCQSKNLVTERNRRNRIKDGLFTLRSLVPKISKMDRAAIVGDAIEYIEELNQELKKLNDELKEIKEEEYKENAELKSSNLDGLHEGKRYLPPAEHNKRSGESAERKTEAVLEVNQIGKRDFLIKYFCEQKRGGFARLMEAINSLELQTVDANITTFNGNVLHILKVEVRLVAMDPN
ncbi:hypothetical protein JRO89_XS05G0081800 [Xanthoceras sorbifolium]|uniref:BHLH domain-containing protein n=1 Tax=Xanthoceras sorbifolium TaxID=99658 RepID=A0ABQ8I0Z0_9ROSI|nr:hypothetical protein JRO89_XS05G0081800 [Xanthoceras sorbifolium]